MHISYSVFIPTMDYARSLLMHFFTLSCPSHSFTIFCAPPPFTLSSPPLLLYLLSPFTLSYHMSHVKKMLRYLAEGPFFLIVLINVDKKERHKKIIVKHFWKLYRARNLSTLGSFPKNSALIWKSFIRWGAVVWKNLNVVGHLLKKGPKVPQIVPKKY